MISRAERRFYILGLCSAFLFGLGLVFIVWNIVVASGILLALGSIFTSFSVPIMFKAFEAVCFPDEYNSSTKQYSSTLYSVGFYVVSIVCAIASLVLLIFILYYGRTVTKTQMLFWGLFLTVCFSLIGRIAERHRH